MRLPRPTERRGTSAPGASPQPSAETHAELDALEMKEEIRRAIAFAVLAPAGGNKDCEIYSYDKDRRSKFSGNSSDFLDYDAGARIIRFGPDLYHYGLWHYVSLTVGEKSFSGYDHGSKCHFEGVVKGETVQLYDHGEAPLLRLWSRLTRSAPCGGCSLRFSVSVSSRRVRRIGRTRHAALRDSPRRRGHQQRGRAAGRRACARIA